MNKITNTLLKLSVGFAILSIVFYKIGFGEIWAILLSVDLWVPFLMIALQILLLAVGALGSWVLLRPISRLGYSEFWKCYCSAWSISLFIPSQVGGASIIYFLHKKGVSVGAGTAIFVIERVITVLVLGFIASFGFFVFFPYNTAIRIICYLLLVFGLGIFVILSRAGRSLVKSFLLRKYQNHFRGFSKTVFMYFKKHKSLLFIMFTYTFLRWCIVSYMVYLMFLLGFGVPIMFYKILMISAVSTIFGLIPLSLNGLGIREGAAVFLYSQIGVAPQIVASVYIVLLAVMYLTGVASGIIFIKKKKGVRVILSD
jgi:glycosyltransferase 2 family protein